MLSFFIIGVIWVNHHALFALAADADRRLMFYNLLLLMWVATIPFTTATLAGYLRPAGRTPGWRYCCTARPPRGWRSASP